MTDQLPDTNQHLLVDGEPTDEMVEHILRRDFDNACHEFKILLDEYERGAFLDVLVRAALAAHTTQEG